jgi:hypothetical protein
MKFFGGVAISDGAPRFLTWSEDVFIQAWNYVEDDRYFSQQHHSQPQLVMINWNWNNWKKVIFLSSPRVNPFFGMVAYPFIIQISKAKVSLLHSFFAHLFNTILILIFLSFTPIHSYSFLFVDSLIHSLLSFIPIVFLFLLSYSHSIYCIEFESKIVNWQMQKYNMTLFSIPNRK